MLSLELSLLLLYLRAFAPGKVTRYLIHFGLTFCFLAYTAFMFRNIFSNVETIINTIKALGTINVLGDIYVLCVPIAAVSKLHLSSKRKSVFCWCSWPGSCTLIPSAEEEETLLRVSQRLCYEYCSSRIPTPIPSSECRFQLPFSNHFTGHVRTLYRHRTASAFFKQLLTLRSTIEEQVRLMCACMPLFPTVVKNSSTIQSCMHVAQYSGSWTHKSSRHSPATEARRGYRKHVSREGSVQDRLELQRQGHTTKIACPESPKKALRMKLGAFVGLERPMSIFYGAHVLLGSRGRKP